MKKKRLETCERKVDVHNKILKFERNVNANRAFML